MLKKAFKSFFLNNYLNIYRSKLIIIYYIKVLIKD